MWIEFALGFMLSVPLWAVIEYGWHRWVMHRPTLSRKSYVDHMRHHGREVWEDPATAWSFPSNGVSPVLNVVGFSSLWLPVWLFCSFWAAAGMATAAAIHGVLWTKLHHEFHRSVGAGPWWTRSRLYRIARQHHMRHHNGPCNYAALLPPAVDALMGTKR